MGLLERAGAGKRLLRAGRGVSAERYQRLLRAAEADGRRRGSLPGMRNPRLPLRGGLHLPNPGRQPRNPLSVLPGKGRPRAKAGGGDDRPERRAARAVLHCGGAQRPVQPHHGAGRRDPGQLPGLRSGYPHRRPGADAGELPPAAERAGGQDGRRCRQRHRRQRHQPDL